MREILAFVFVIAVLLIGSLVVCKGLKAHTQDKLSDKIRWPSSQMDREIRKSIRHNKWV